MEFVFTKGFFFLLFLFFYVCTYGTFFLVLYVDVRDVGHVLKVCGRLYLFFKRSLALVIFRTCIIQ